MSILLELAAVGIAWLLIARLRPPAHQGATSPTRLKVYGSPSAWCGCCLLWPVDDGDRHPRPRLGPDPRAARARSTPPPSGASRPIGAVVRFSGRAGLDVPLAAGAARSADRDAIPPHPGRLPDRPRHRILPAQHRGARRLQALRRLPLLRPDRGGHRRHRAREGARRDGHLPHLPGRAALRHIDLRRQRRAGSRHHGPHVARASSAAC